MAGLTMLPQDRNFAERQDKASEPSWPRELRLGLMARPTITLEKGCPAERLRSARDWRPRGAEMCWRGIPCFMAQLQANCLWQAAPENALPFATAARWPWWKASASMDAST